MGDRLKGKNAVVTGGGNGIGRAISLAFAGEGASILIADYGVSRGGEGSDASPADKVVAEIKAKGGNAAAHFANVADFKAAEGILDTCVQKFGRVDILVNCAGILREKMVWNMTEEDWDVLLGVHLKGTFNCSRRAAALMREQRGGRIINLAAEAWKGATGQANYCAAKGGIVSFTRALARELGRYGVTANAIAPLAGTRLTMTPEVIASAKRQYEAGQLTKEFYETVTNLPGPEFVAPLFVYLASDKAANINGRIFFASKGKVAIYSEPVEQYTIYKTDADGMWTLAELEKFVPSNLLVGYVNPSPVEPPKEKK